jgi:hypothetical protein
MTADRARAWLAALLLAFTAMSAMRLHEVPVGSLNDDAIYIAMARSIVAGRGPLVHPGPDAPAANPGVFPPGFPLLLSPLAALQPQGLGLLTLVPWLGAALLLALGWRLSRGDDPATRLALLAGLALNPWLVAWSLRVVSDLPFAALASGALLAATGLVDDRAPSRRRYAAVILLTGGALLVRSVGLAALLAIIATLAKRGLWRRAGIVLAGVTAMQLVLLLPGWSAGAGWPGDGYREQMLAHHAGIDARAAFMAGNLAGYARESAALMIPVFGGPLEARLGPAAGWLQAATALALIALVALGARRRLRERRDASAGLWLWYAGFTLVALANFQGWPSGVQLRLLLPLLPALWWWALAGAPSGRARKALVVVAALACLGHGAWRVARPLEEASAAAGRGFVDPGDGGAWIAANTGPGDVIIAPDPLPRHVRLNRPVIALGEPDLAAMQARAATHGARWLLLAPSLQGPPRRLDESGLRWRTLLRQAGWTPAWADSALAVSIWRLPDAR